MSLKLESHSLLLSEAVIKSVPDYKLNITFSVLLLYSMMLYRYLYFTRNTHLVHTTSNCCPCGPQNLHKINVHVFTKLSYVILKSILGLKKK